MNNLPDLPFERVLVHLGLKDLLRARAVSREFKRQIDNFRVSSLCFSEWEPDYIEDNHRLIAGEFAQNFISSLKFESFFAHYGRSVLSELRRLRVCDLDVEGKTAQLIEIVNSFQKLENLSFVRVLHLRGDCDLQLPELKSLHIDELYEEKSFGASPKFTVTLDAPRLSEIWIGDYCQLDIKLIVIHPESVECVMIPSNECLALESFKNLKSLRFEFSNISDNFLSNLERLREIHVGYSPDRRLYDQKQRYGRSELKIYYRGVCLDNPDDCPDFLDNYPNCFYFSEEALRFWTENYSRVADQVAYYSCIVYSQMVTEFSETPEHPKHPFSEEYAFYDQNQQVEEYNIRFPTTPLPADLWGRLIYLKEIELDVPAKNVAQFFNFLSGCPRVCSLLIRSHQPQALLAQLPFYCSPQILKMYDLIDEEVTFLPKFKGLIRLSLGNCSLNVIQEVLKQLKFVRYFHFYYRATKFRLEIRKGKQPRLFVNRRELGPFTDRDMVAEFISYYGTPARRD